MRIDFIPILLEIAKGITHGVRIFGSQHGTVVLRIAGYRKQTLPSGIFGTFHIVVSHTGIEIFILRAGIETGDDIDGRRIGSPPLPLPKGRNPPLPLPKGGVT